MPKGRRVKDLENKMCFKSIKDAAEKTKALFEPQPKTVTEKKDYPSKLEVIDAQTKFYNAVSYMVDGIDADQDSLHKYVMNALRYLANTKSNECIHDLRDGITEQATQDNDSDASNLTGWLNRSSKNLKYLTKALVHVTSDGFNALQYAQYLQIEDIYLATVDVLAEMVEKYPCDTSN